MSNTFLGSLETMERSDFTFVGINYCSAEYLSGVELAADKIRELSSRYANADGSAHPLKVYSPEEGYILYDALIQDSGNVDVNSNLGLDEALLSVEFAKGSIPIFVGGDHSATYHNIKRLSKELGEEQIVVVQFDAHSDYIDEFAEYPHGSVMNETRKLKNVSKIVHFGIRGNLNCGPAITRSKEDGNVIAPYYELRDSLDAVIEAIEGQKVYITFDADFMCPAYAPATNCPEPGGPNYEETLEYMKMIIQHAGKIVGMDFVEYNPTLEGAVLTGTTIVNLIMEALSYVRGKNTTS